MQREKIVEEAAVPSAVCTICGGKETLTRIGNVPSGTTPAERYTVVQCRLCRSQAVIQEENTYNESIYDDVYSSSEDGGYSRYKDFAALQEPASVLSAEFVYAAAFAAISKIGPKRIVEVGSGLGYFTAALRSKGFEAFGIDLSSAAVRDANARYGNWFRTSEDRPLSELFVDVGPVDLILSLEVIEHVPDPGAFLASIAELAEQHNADLLISTPNRDFASDSACWHTDLPPIHLHWISREGLRQLLLNNGFESREHVVDLRMIRKQNLLTTKLREYLNEPWLRVRYSNQSAVPDSKISHIRGFLVRLSRAGVITKFSNRFAARFLSQYPNLVVVCSRSNRD